MWGKNKFIGIGLLYAHSVSMITINNALLKQQIKLSGILSMISFSKNTVGLFQKLLLFKKGQPTWLKLILK